MSEGGVPPLHPTVPPPLPAPSSPTQGLPPLSPNQPLRCPASSLQPGRCPHPKAALTWHSRPSPQLAGGPDLLCKWTWVAVQSLLVPFSSPLTAPSNSMHSLCQQGAVCNWLPSPRYCIQSLYLEESLPLHQSDPYLKASNLPYISLINFEFPAFITSPLETSLQIVYYSFIVSSLQHPLPSG